MINKKILISYLALLLFMILYIVNQVLFMNVLVQPSNSEFAWIDESFRGFLLADNSEYIDAAKDFDKNTDTCSIFVDPSTSSAVYTEECNLNNETYISDSQPKTDKSFIEYNSIYEYLYSIKLLAPIGSASSIDFPRYDTLLTSKDFASTNDIKDMSDYFTSTEIAKKRYLYTVYSEESKALVLDTQTRILKIASTSMLILFVFGYVSLKRQEIVVYKILGLNSLMLVKKIFMDFFIMLTISFTIAFSTFRLITWLNGKLFYASMYFEYMDIRISATLYFIFLFVICIILLGYYVQLRSHYD